MPARYLKSAGGNWSAAATWSATSAAGVDSVGPPTAADDVILELASGAVTIDAASVCRSLDTTSGVGSYGGTITHNAGFSLNIGDATAGAGNVALKFNSGMTYTLGSVTTSLLGFLSTSATVQTITTAGKALGSYSINGVGSSYQLTDSNTIGTTSILSHIRGTLNTNTQACSWGTFNSSVATTRALDITNSAITITGTGTSWQCGIADPGGLTMTTTGSTITQSGAGVTFNGGAKTYNNIVQSGSGVATMNLNTAGNTTTLTGNYTRTPTAVKTDSVIFRNSMTAVTITLNSNSVTNRLLVQGITFGTPVSLTATTLVCTNVIDFQDITGAGAATWTTGASGATYFGDCGGNSGITVTTPATQTATGTASFTWSTHGWTSRVPLPQDNVVINNAFIAGRTITVDMPRIGANITVSGATGAPAFTWAAVISSYGNVAMASNVVPSGGTSAWTLAGRGAQTITNNGVTWGDVTRITISPVVGSYTLQDAFTAATSASPSLISTTTGTFDSGNFNISTGQLATSTGATLTLGTSTVTLNGTSSGGIMNIATGSTVNASAATFVIGSATASRTFSGGNKTYGTLTYTVAGSTGTLVIANSNTFAVINFSDATNARILQFTSGITTTIPGTGWNVNGTSGKLMTVNAVTPASPATTSFTGRYGSSDYLVVQDITATTNSLYAGANSTNSGGDTNVIFTVPPSTTSSSNILLMGV